VALLVDDAQLLDQASIDALVFAVRRLESDAVAALFAASEEAVPAFDAAGFETIVLRGLDLEATARIVPPAGRPPPTVRPRATLSPCASSAPPTTQRRSPFLAGSRPPSPNARRACRRVRTRRC
jgi:hypothetical protein